MSPAIETRTAVQQIILSVSEKRQYNRCRRRWDIMSHNRRYLRPIRLPKAYYLIGGLFHEGLHGHRIGKNPIYATLVRAEYEKSKFRDRYVAAAGAQAWTDELDVELATHVDFSWRLVKQYFAHYGKRNPLPHGWNYICSEVDFWVDITGVLGLDGVQVILSGRIDAIAVDLAGLFWIVEHKTYRSAPDTDTLWWDDQFRSYVWVLTQMIGQRNVGGVLYDGARKKLAEKPAFTKKGAVSRSKNITTTVDLYLEAIAEAEANPEDYKDTLKVLAERGAGWENNLFTRKLVAIPPAVLDEWAQTTVIQAREMADNPRIFPNFRYEGCDDCKVQDLCEIMQKGGDEQAHINMAYRKGRERVWPEECDLLAISSAEDLLNVPLGTRMTLTLHSESLREDSIH